MDTGNANISEGRTAAGESVNDAIEERLNELLAINAEVTCRKSSNLLVNEELAAEIMLHPISLEKSFAYFGLMIGSFPPAAIMSSFILNSSSNVWFTSLMLAANILTAIIGYFSGKYVAKCVDRIREFPLLGQVVLLPFIGLFWGVISGGIGGAIILLYGGIVGAIFGGAVGLVSLPIFTVLHRLASRAGVIERKYFLPIGFGITLTICGYILGL